MKYVLLPLLLVASLESLRAQAPAITSSDIAQIQQQALRSVRQFEGLLNVLAQPDQYFKENNYRELIQNYYQAGSEYQIFYDSLVMIESDLDPTTQSNDSAEFLPIKDYLEAFFVQYEKSPVASVFFSDFNVSAVKQGEVTYVEVSYSSEFTGHSQSHPDLSYPVRQRTVRVMAQLQADQWQVFIIKLRSRTLKVVPVEERRNTKFLEVSRVYQPGKTYSLPIQINQEAPPSSLILYRDDQQVEDLSDVLVDSSLTWRVPQQIERGSGYRWELYDPSARETLKSDSFIIRKRFP